MKPPRRVRRLEERPPPTTRERGTRRPAVRRLSAAAFALAGTASLFPSVAAMAAAEGTVADEDETDSPLLLSPAAPAHGRRDEMPGMSAYEHFLERSVRGEGLHARTSYDRDVEGRKLERTQHRRRLNDPSLYRPPNIRFDSSNLDPLSSSHALEVSYLKSYIIPEVLQIWGKALRVLPTEGTLYVNPGVCGTEVEIPQNYHEPREGESGEERGVAADLVVFARGFAGKEGGCVTSMLGSAIPCLLNALTDRPVVGVVFFCLENVRATMQNGIVGEEEIMNFGKHEFAHLLGFTSVLYPYYRDMATLNLAPRTPLRNMDQFQCAGNKRLEVLAPGEETVKMGTSTTGMIHFDVVTPAVRQVVRNQFGCETLPGARLENQPTNSLDCFGSHWDERVFLLELMGPRLDRGHVLSPLTLAMMEDTGWYLADYSQAEGVSPFGHGRGCPFVEESCMQRGQLPAHARGNFCNKRMYVENGALQNAWLCDPSLQYRAQCDLVDHNVFVAASRNPPPQDIGAMYYHMEGFTEKNSIGPFTMFEADYCPVAHLVEISCQDSSVPAEVSGETYGESSMCFDGLLQSRKSENNQDGTHSLCLRSECKPDSGTLEVYVDGNTIVCESDFQMHPYPFSGDPNDKFICPSLAQACPNQFCPNNCRGRGRCEYSADGKRATCICADSDDTTPDCSRTPYCALTKCPPPPTPQPTLSPTTLMPTQQPTEPAKPTKKKKRKGAKKGGKKGCAVSETEGSDVTVGTGRKRKKGCKKQQEGGKRGKKRKDVVETPVVETPAVETPAVETPSPTTLAPVTSAPVSPPTRRPRFDPTRPPTPTPKTFSPTSSPTFEPTLSPSSAPTRKPTTAPSPHPSVEPTVVISSAPSSRPSISSASNQTEVAQISPPMLFSSSAKGGWRTSEMGLGITVIVAIAGLFLVGWAPP